METIEIEIKSLLKVRLELKTYPKLTSDKKLIKKALEIVKNHSPKIYNYVSKEDVISNLENYKLKILHSSKLDEEETKKVLSLWLKKEKIKRLIYSAIELLLFPVSAIFTPIPGPNLFFYSLVILFYFHFKGFLRLKGVSVDDLKVVDG